MSAMEKLSNYAEAAADLAEALRSDIIAGHRITVKTVMALSTFEKNAQAMKALLDQLEKSVVKLN